LAIGEVGEKNEGKDCIAQMPVLPVHLCINDHNMLKQITVSSVKQPINQ
jgi:hypothetical protein